jgi:hypothetical protein
LKKVRIKEPPVPGISNPSENLWAPGKKQQRTDGFQGDFFKKLRTRVIYENWVFDVSENWHGYHPTNHPDTRFGAVSNNCPTLVLTTTYSLYGNILERQFWKIFFFVF